MIEIKNLKKTYRERTVLDIDKLIIDDGTILAVAGANGSGKSTLLRILACQLKATEGEIASPENSLYMPQQAYAFRGNLIDNITLSGADRETAKQLLEKLELSHLSEKKATSLSGGELQRLSLCRVLSKKAELLLLDEPTSACDVRGAELVVNAIKDYQKENGCTVIMSTHAPALALKAADRMIILGNGKIEADGTPADIFSKPETDWAKSFTAGWKTDA